MTAGNGESAAIVAARMQPRSRHRSASPLLLTEARRVVVKVGSALLVDQGSGRLNRTWLEALVADLRRMRRRGQQVIVVSSGAVALGRRQQQQRIGGRHRHCYRLSGLWERPGRSEPLRRRL